MSIKDDLIKIAVLDYQECPQYHNYWVNFKLGEAKKDINGRKYHQRLFDKGEDLIYRDVDHKRYALPDGEYIEAYSAKIKCNVIIRKDKIKVIEK